MMWVQVPPSGPNRHAVKFHGAVMPALPERPSELFVYDEDTGAASSRESKRLEFKQNFEPNDVSDYTKVLAFFANTAGGTIIFGVTNKPKRIVGCTNMVDEADWVNALRSDFDPEIAITIREYTIGGNTVYAVSTTRPCTSRSYARIAPSRSPTRRATGRTS